MGEALQTTPLHEEFGVEVHGVDLREVTADSGYADIRAAFETHSLLLFRDQHLSDEEHLAFARLFGPLEDREVWPEPEICPVSNVTEDGQTAPEDDSQTLNLRANQLWHACPGERAAGAGGAVHGGIRPGGRSGPTQ